MIKLNWFIVCFGLMLGGCVTMEQQCDRDVMQGRFPSHMQCMATRQANFRKAANSVGDVGESMQRSQQPQQNSSTDLTCVNSCLAAGYMLGLCNSKCSY